jgi:hypothetical protein
MVLCSTSGCSSHRQTRNHNHQPERIAAAAVACQHLFDTWNMVSVFMIFRNANALLLMRCSSLPVRRLPVPVFHALSCTLGQPAGRRELVDPLVPIPDQGGRVVIHQQLPWQVRSLKVYSGLRVIVCTFKMVVLAGQIVMPPNLQSG